MKPSLIFHHFLMDQEVRKCRSGGSSQTEQSHSCAQSGVFAELPAPPPTEEAQRSGGEVGGEGVSSDVRSASIKACQGGCSRPLDYFIWFSEQCCQHQVPVVFFDHPDHVFTIPSVQIHPPHGQYTPLTPFPALDSRVSKSGSIETPKDQIVSPRSGRWSGRC